MNPFAARADKSEVLRFLDQGLGDRMATAPKKEMVRVVN